jgi:hypothetical protein
MQDSLPECSPLCKAFRCDKRPSAFKVSLKNGRRTVECTYAEDECEASYCKFGVCAEHKMTGEGRCRSVAKRPEIDTDEIPQEVFEPEQEQVIPEKFAKKLRGMGSR